MVAQYARFLRFHVERSIFFFLDAGTRFFAVLRPVTGKLETDERLAFQGKRTNSMETASATHSIDPSRWPCNAKGPFSDGILINFYERQAPTELC